MERRSEEIEGEGREKAVKASACNRNTRAKRI